MIAISYPQFVQESLHQVTNVLAEAPGLVSVLLLGSTARGELAYCELDQGLEIFSDYEFLVVTERHLGTRERRRIGTQLSALERQFAQRNPLFHIDVTFRERRRLRTLPRIIFTYELKANAQVMCGEDVRSLVPEVTLANLNLRNANEILIKRLWATLLNTPRRMLGGSLTGLEQMVWGYVLCRNTLDLTTVLLPHRGVLLPSYSERVKHLKERYGQLGLAPRFGEDFPAFVAACLEERRTLRFSGSLLQGYAKVISYLRTALGLLLDAASPADGPVAERLVTDSRRVFEEWPISRGEWANLMRLTFRYARSRGPLAATRWLRSPKKGLTAAGLLAAHRALIGHQARQDDEAAAQLAQSARLLASIALTSFPSLEGDFATGWLALRRAWGEFWREYVRLGDPRYGARFDFVTEWENG